MHRGTIYNFQADLLEFKYYLKCDDEGKVTVNNVGKTILVTTKDELKIEDKTF